MTYYLAFDKGSSKRADHKDRYEIINLTGLTKKGSFSRISYATDFTRQFRNYSDLFLNLYNKGLVTSEYVGKPFTLCYESKSGEWLHAGCSKYRSENQVLFKDQAYLADKPSEEELKEGYSILVNQQDLSYDKKYTVPFALTCELLAQELSIPEYWHYENASAEEQEHFDFLDAFTSDINTKVNYLKKSRAYGEHKNFAIRVNRIDCYNDDLKIYLGLAAHEHFVDPRYFDKSIRKIIHLLCVKGLNDKHQTIDIDNTQLFNLATYFVSYYSRLHHSFERETALLKEQVDLIEAQKTNPFIMNVPKEECVQMTFFGEEIPYSELEKKRKRKR